MVEKTKVNKELQSVEDIVEPETDIQNEELELIVNNYIESNKIIFEYEQNGEEKKKRYNFKDIAEKNYEDNKFTSSDYFKQVENSINQKWDNQLEMFDLEVKYVKDDKNDIVPHSIVFDLPHEDADTIDVCTLHNDQGVLKINNTDKLKKIESNDLFTDVLRSTNGKIYCKDQSLKSRYNSNLNYVIDNSKINSYSEIFNQEFYIINKYISIKFILYGLMLMIILPMLSIIVGLAILYNDIDLIKLILGIILYPILSPIILMFDVVKFVMCFIFNRKQASKKLVEIY